MQIKTCIKWKGDSFINLINAHTFFIKKKLNLKNFWQNITYFQILTKFFKKGIKTTSRLSVGLIYAQVSVYSSKNFLSLRTPWNNRPIDMVGSVNKPTYTNEDSTLGSNFKTLVFLKEGVVPSTLLKTRKLRRFKLRLFKLRLFKLGVISTKSRCDYRKYFTMLRVQQKYNNRLRRVRLGGFNARVLNKNFPGNTISGPSTRVTNSIMYKYRMGTNLKPILNKFWWGRRLRIKLRRKSKFLHKKKFSNKNKFLPLAASLNKSTTKKVRKPTKKRARTYLNLLTFSRGRYVKFTPLNNRIRNKNINNSFLFKKKINWVVIKSFETPQLTKSIKLLPNKIPCKLPKSSKYKPSRTSLLLKNFGLFLVNQVVPKQAKNLELKPLFKKKIFSFFVLNEVRRNLMFRKKKFFTYRFLLKSRTTILRLYNRTMLYKKFSNSHLFLFANLNAFSQSFKFNNQLLNNRPISHSKTGLDFIFTRDEVDFEGYFNLRKHFFNIENSELFFKRIRFKPGYQRIWRHARLALLEFFNLKMVYQQQLTKYISIFTRASQSYVLNFTEMVAVRLISYSKLLPDCETTNKFFKLNFIYLNGNNLSNLNVLLSPNDCLQLIISPWMYTYHRWVLNNSIFRDLKFRKLVYRKGLAAKYQVVKLRKQRSRLVPNWVYKYRYDFNDVRPYLEVDYLTLSALVVYNPFIYNLYFPDSLVDLKSNVYKMYNWKYIT